MQCWQKLRCGAVVAVVEGRKGHLVVVEEQEVMLCLL
jgi:hypothetical protein